MIGNANHHPEHERRIYSRSEENGNTSAEVIDSSLCATIPFPIFPTKHSCSRSNDGGGKARHQQWGTESVIMRMLAAGTCSPGSFKRKTPPL